MVGALTVMIVILAVFLAYNANNGLPFVPDLPDLGPGPERRTRSCPATRSAIGGVRVGADRGDRAGPARGRQRSAPRLDLKLDRDVDPLPVDSTVIVRARSALGLKYLEINQGDLRRGLSRRAR